MASIIGYGSYVPYWRLQRKAIGGALGGRGGSGTRAVASYDEDTTSMAVEAARPIIGPETTVDSVIFATTAPAYLDKTNANAIHAALALPASTFASDAIGSVRSTAAAFRAAAANSESTLVAIADQRIGLPNSADERDGGDGAAAFLFGPGDGIAEIIGTASSSVELLDRWRIPGDIASRTWEERFAEPVFVSAATDAFADALKKANVTPDEIDKLIVTGVHTRAAKTARKALGIRPEAVVPDLVDVIGNTGAAHPGILLAGVLDEATPGQVIGLVVLGDGADAFVLRVREGITSARQPLPLATQVAAGNDTLRYADFLTWRGQLRREPPRRPDPDTPMAPPALRSTRWKFGLVGSRCTSCDERFAPPQRVCLNCGAVDEMAEQPFAGAKGVVRTFTVDRLSYSPSPPLVAAVIDIDGGGRLEFEVTDLVGPESVAVGDEVELTFRRLYTVDGVHNYFWKARPQRTVTAGSGGEDS